MNPLSGYSKYIRAGGNDENEQQSKRTISNLSISNDEERDYSQDDSNDSSFSSISNTGAELYREFQQAKQHPSSLLGLSKQTGSKSGSTLLNKNRNDNNSTNTESEDNGQEQQNNSFSDIGATGSGLLEEIQQIRSNPSSIGSHLKQHQTTTHSKPTPRTTTTTATTAPRSNDFNQDEEEQEEPKESEDSLFTKGSELIHGVQQTKQNPLSLSGLTKSNPNKPHQTSTGTNVDGEIRNNNNNQEPEGENEETTLSSIGTTGAHFFSQIQQAKQNPTSLLGSKSSNQKSSTMSTVTHNNSNNNNNVNNNNNNEEEQGERRNNSNQATSNSSEELSLSSIGNTGTQLFHQLQDAKKNPRGLFGFK
ncbi:hypothetical protein CYY_000176 [Polysphondylium violaceum]|uniref:Uncharacterized protein n=1 Tax=Polysphondylium violaceum TaxID=133409 RepID=A0A8J4Q581_9MYCE|nr:hypothetical protein CYY_000176 [Polysphondylium violaceum]